MAEDPLPSGTPQPATKEDQDYALALMHDALTDFLGYYKVIPTDVLMERAAQAALVAESAFLELRPGRGRGNLNSPPEEVSLPRGGSSTNELDANAKLEPSGIGRTKKKARARK